MMVLVLVLALVLALAALPTQDLPPRLRLVLRVVVAQAAGPSTRSQR